MTYLDAAAAIVGPTQILTGEALAPWRRDWTGQYLSDPAGLVRPGSTAEVSALLALASRHGQAIVPVSGATGLTGGAVAGPEAVLLSTERLSTIRSISAAERTAEVEAGVVLSTLHAAAEEEGLLYPVTFGARGSARIGGLLATNAGGSNVLAYGNTRDTCLGIEAVLPDGRVLSLMSALHKDNSGLNLRHLMIGSEGQLGIITAAVLKLVPAPRIRATAMLAPRDLAAALTLLNRLQDETGGKVVACEYMPDIYIAGHLRYVAGAREPFGQRHAHNVMIELASPSAADAAPGEDGQPRLSAQLEALLAGALEEGLILDATIAQSEAQRAEMWARRESAAELTFARRPFVDCDIAVPLAQVAAFLQLIRQRVRALVPGAEDMVVAHLGDGNIHYTIYPGEAGLAQAAELRALVDGTAVELGGSFSAEHGIGLSKLPAMRAVKDPVAVETMRAIKAALDPAGLLNAGKTIP
ncbi:FAD-binding oxidoreductase [Pseudoroseicyclus tamaricis]|uniref:FAD-binding oxidoreductase n=1 Tax=Pseudoroseicyclus tamaricis TaxID=2705421 RepID=A0A6B2K0Z7_9RHOB|nr:FAD-binding oxidoreductase [Pseudoroseicyclus tamaricis]NDV02619.1 FAD-binding oxidoreductase [Pseudoroseicyclus tamaricis]